MDTKVLEAALSSALHGEHSSLTVSFNDEHSPNYVTAKEWAEKYGGYGPEDGWWSEQDRYKALSKNSVWTIQWYPDTPVGFYVVRASSFEGAIRAFIEAHK